MRIQTNSMAFNAWRNLNISQGSMASSLEKLSSGYRINRAADDAAGLVISQNLRAQVSGLQQATRNAQDGISVVQTAEGALNEIQNMLNRMRDLAVQAANTGTNDNTARTAAQAEVTQLTSEITRIAGATSFGQMKLLDGSFGKTAGASTAFSTSGNVTVTAGDTISVVVTGGSAGVTATLTAGTYTGAQWAALVQGSVRAALSASSNAVDQAASANFGVSSTTVGGGAALTFSNGGSAAIALADGTGTPLGTGAGFAASAAGTVAAATGTGGAFQVGAYAPDQITVGISAVTTAGLGVSSLDLVNNASAALSAIDTAISSVSSTRGNLGAIQNRFQSTINNLQVSTENLQASVSRIRDTDMALEMASFTRSQILQQAGTAMLAQANAAPQSILRLLQG